MLNPVLAFLNYNSTENTILHVKAHINYNNIENPVLHLKVHVKYTVMKQRPL
jgi:hypothetical protein